MKKILFLCHGNICRSPLAEHLFNLKIKEKKLENNFMADSKAISYEEIGNTVYSFMQKEIQKQGLPYLHHIACHFDQNEYANYDYIFYMDRSNYRLLSRYIKDEDHKIKIISYYTNDIDEIEDPWYTRNFTKAFHEISTCVDDIIKHICS